jgi:voltage-gated potassium channel
LRILRRVSSHDRTVQAEEVNPAVRRFSAIGLLVALTILFAAFPFIEKLESGDMLKSILLTVVLLSAVWTVAGRGPILVTALFLAVPTMAARWVHLYRPDLLPPEVFLIGAILLVLFVNYHLLRSVLRAREVTTEVLCASIAAYLLLGLAWTFAYWLVAELVPGAFSLNVTSGSDGSIKGFNGFYFSFITLSTVGYGDITPVASVARMLAAAEAMTGLLYVAVLIARLVSLHVPKSPDEK